MQNFRIDLLKDLKKVAPRRNIKLTEDIKYCKEGDQIWLLMSKSAIGYGTSTNMQKDSDTFEGWATIIKAHYTSDEIRKVVLDVDIDEMPSVEKVFSSGIAYYISPPYNLEHMLSYSKKDNKTGKWYIAKKGE